MTPVEELRAAAKTLCGRVEATRERPDERWMVDQSPDNGLVLGSFTPDDVLDDGTVMTGCVAFFAYPGDDGLRTYANALAVVSYMVTVQPHVGMLLGELLDHVADVMEAEGAEEQVLPLIVDPDGLRVVFDGNANRREDWTAALALARAINGGTR